jgi:membrane protein implicated in regulation of membrane protease activity
MPDLKNSTNVLAFIRAVLDHWTTLMSGGIITVLLGVFERFSGKNVPLWVYGGILIFFAFLACYLAWRDARKAVTQTSLNEQKRQFLAGRLQSLLNEAGTVEHGWVSLRSDEGMEKIGRATAYQDRVKTSSRSTMGRKPRVGMMKRDLISLNHYWQIATKTSPKA